MEMIDFDCYVCLETRSEDIEQVEFVADKWICSKCVPAAIVQPFEATLQHEMNYPPMRDRSTPLNFDDFQHLFTYGFADDWCERIKECETPVRRRVYCELPTATDDARDGPDDPNFCNKFLGELGTGDMVESERCGSWTCLQCRLQPYEPPKDEPFCEPPEADESAASFDPETRGKEWQ